MAFGLTLPLKTRWQAMPSSLTEDQLRQQIRVRLSKGLLPLLGGPSKSQRGTGRSCVVCRRGIEPAEIECELNAPGIGVVAHDTCYELWRIESVVHRVDDRVRRGSI